MDYFTQEQPSIQTKKFTPLSVAVLRVTSYHPKELKLFEISQCCLQSKSLWWEHLWKPQSQKLRNLETVEGLHDFEHLSFHPEIEAEQIRLNLPKLTITYFEKNHSEERQFVDKATLHQSCFDKEIVLISIPLESTH